MKFFSTATQIGQAFKNVGRAREILAVFGSHGFAELIYRMQLSRVLPGRIQRKFNPEVAAPLRLRLAFEALGPTFVKLGQLLATRRDLIPQAFAEEFQKLQDEVSFVPLSDIRTVIESELGCALEDVFTDFSPTPLAAASIAQVHSARLKTGEKVAVKVQRPGIDRTVQNDVSVLKVLAQLLERYVAETRPANPVGLVDEFFQTMLHELDFRIEANNIRRISANLATLPKVAVPKVYEGFNTKRVLVLEQFEGVRLLDREELIRVGVDPSSVIVTGADAFFHMVMQDGLFHADPHAGNIFVLSDGKIGFIDFGMVGRLSRRVRDSIITMFLAIMDEDYESLASEYMDLCISSRTPDPGKLQKDLMDTISPYVGMSLGDVNIGQILLRSTSIASHHGLRVPRELMLLFKAILTIEALGKRLDPQFDILEVGNRLARQVVTVRYSRERILRDLAVSGRELQSLAEATPRLIKRFLKNWSGNEFAFEVRSRDSASVARALNRLSRSVLVFAMSLCMTLLGIILIILPSFSRAVELGFICIFGAVLVSGFHLWRSKESIRYP